MASPQHQADRYNTSKLLEILIIQELGALTTASSKLGKPPVIINTINPGYCVSELQRNANPVLYALIKLGGVFIARDTEVGSRTLFAGAVAGEESHGKYMSDCIVKDPSTFVRSEDGLVAQKKVFQQLLVVLEGIEPGLTKNA